MGQITMFNLSVTHCQICGRELTDPQSIRLGIGPICRAKEAADHDQAQHTDTCKDHLILESLNPNGLVLRRDDDGGVWTNVSHVVTHHSPTGFEFGYGGSGPADLALNVVENILYHLNYTGPRMRCFDGTCFELAFTLHQDFKWDFISQCPRAGGRIPYEVIKTWIIERMEV